MTSSIIQIGNSRGIILPAEFLRRLGLSLKSAVNISIDNDSILIKPQPRQGWAAAARQAHENGDDRLLIPDFFNDENTEEWTW